MMANTFLFETTQAVLEEMSATRSQLIEKLELLPEIKIPERAPIPLINRKIS